MPVNCMAYDNCRLTTFVARESLAPARAAAEGFLRGVVRLKGNAVGMLLCMA